MTTAESPPKEKKQPKSIAAEAAGMMETASNALVYNGEPGAAVNLAVAILGGLSSVDIQVGLRAMELAKQALQKVQQRREEDALRAIEARAVTQRFESRFND